MLLLASQVRRSRHFPRSVSSPLSLPTSAAHLPGSPWAWGPVTVLAGPGSTGANSVPTALAQSASAEHERPLGARGGRCEQPGEVFLPRRSGASQEDLLVAVKILNQAPAGGENFREFLKDGGEGGRWRGWAKGTACSPWRGTSCGEMQEQGPEPASEVWTPVWGNVSTPHRDG